MLTVFRISYQKFCLQEIVRSNIFTAVVICGYTYKVLLRYAALKMNLQTFQINSKCASDQHWSLPRFLS